MKRIEIVCHKGANEYAPENTYAAAWLCVEWGMDFVEVDVNMSKDGVLYLLHGPTLDKTTNGKGKIRELTSGQIDALDAGSWFDPSFAAERVPRLEPFLRWIKGKAKVFFDVKAAHLPHLIDLVYALGFEDDCFFWFGREQDALAFRRLDSRLALKINVKNAAEVIQADQIFGASIVEVQLKDMSTALVEECRRRGIKLMIYEQQKNLDAFRRVLAWEADMVNLDHGDVFAQVAQEYYGGVVAQPAASWASVKAQDAGAKRVILFLLDGCRPDAITAASAPVICGLMARGAWTLKAQTIMPSITLPCHTSLFYSLLPARHGVLSND